jgi:hypothetical protein
MEAWRQRRSGEKKELVEQNENRIHLTPPGLLMEGVNTQIPIRCDSVHNSFVRMMRVIAFGDYPLTASSY